MVTKSNTDKTSGEASWSWEDSKWQKIIDKVRAGRSLKPKQKGLRRLWKKRHNLKKAIITGKKNP